MDFNLLKLRGPGQEKQRKIPQWIKTTLALACMLVLTISVAGCRSSPRWDNDDPNAPEGKPPYYHGDVFKTL